MSRDRGGTKGRGQFCSWAELAQSRSGSVRRVRGGLDSWGRNWRWSAGWDRTLPIAWGEKVGMAILSVCIPVLAAGQTCRKGWCPGGLTDWMNELRVPVGGEPHSFISVVFFLVKDGGAWHATVHGESGKIWKLNSNRWVSVSHTLEDALL